MMMKYVALIVLSVLANSSSAQVLQSTVIKISCNDSLSDVKIMLVKGGDTFYCVNNDTLKYQNIDNMSLIIDGIEYFLYDDTANIRSTLFCPQVYLGKVNNFEIEVKIDNNFYWVIPYSDCDYFEKKILRQQFAYPKMGH